VKNTLSRDAIVGNCVDPISEGDQVSNSGMIELRKNVRLGRPGERAARTALA
jgi:hypothetical protein